MIRLFLAVLLSKTINFICHVFNKKGNQLPGYFIYDVFLDHKVLERVKYPKYFIAVTGSSGKGTTCSLLKHVLIDNNMKVINNDTGNNGVLGVISFILTHCSLSGKIKADAIVLECDEKHLKLIFQENKPTHLIITNVTRDQPGRNGTPLIVYNDILKVIDNNINLIINEDDPLLARLKTKYKNITTYGISKTKYDYTKPDLNNVDFAYCPKCNTKLVYDYYHYGHIGGYKCPNCDFCKGNVDFNGTNINLENKTMKINNDLIKLNKGAMYVCYATLATFATASKIDIAKEKILYALNDDIITSKRGKELTFDNRKVVMLETKNENNLSYYQSLKYITNQNNVKTIILGFENVSRRYKLNDLSWLYDVSFELLNNDSNIDKIICIGRFKYDVATRLEYANVDKNKIILVDNLDNLVNIVKDKSKGDIYTMVCFDMTAVIRKMIEDEN